MKFLAFTICFYLTVLTVLPTVRAVKMTFAEDCRKTCGMDDSTMPNGCEKEKCLLNFNFNTIPYLVFTTDYQWPKHYIGLLRKEKTVYHTTLTSHFSVTIWQPPETVS